MCNKTNTSDGCYEVRMYCLCACLLLCITSVARDEGGGAIVSQSECMKRCHKFVVNLSLFGIIEMFKEFR